MKSILLTFCISLLVSVALFIIILNVIGASNDEENTLAVTFVISLQLCVIISILLTQNKKK